MTISLPTRLWLNRQKPTFRLRTLMGLIAFAAIWMGVEPIIRTRWQHVRDHWQSLADQAKTQEHLAGCEELDASFLSRYVLEMEKQIKDTEAMTSDQRLRRQITPDQIRLWKSEIFRDRTMIAERTKSGRARWTARTNSEAAGGEPFLGTQPMTSPLRMPIVYLLAAMIAVAAVATFWIGKRRSNTQQISSKQIQSSDQTQESKSSSITQSSDPFPVIVKGSDGILRTKEGLRRKVLVTTLGLVPLSAAEGGKPVGEPLDYASIAFVFGETNVADPPLFQVGPREGPPLGWVPSTAVVEWETRLMARPAPRETTAARLVSRGSMFRAVLSDQACSKHAPKPCPIEGEEPPGANGFGTTILGLPILRTAAVAPPNQASTNLFEVAALVSDRTPLILPKILPEDLKEAVRHVHVLFAIDTTASMRDSLDSTIKFVMLTIESFKNLYGNNIFRFGLVEYRDRSPAFSYVTRVDAILGDSSEFSGKLGALVAADRGDDSIDEAVFDGIELALPVESGNDRLGWSSGRLGEVSTKLLVLIGDAPDHARDLKRAKLSRPALETPGSRSLSSRSIAATCCLAMNPSDFKRNGKSLRKDRFGRSIARRGSRSRRFRFGSKTPTV